MISRPPVKSTTFGSLHKLPIDRSSTPCWDSLFTLKLGAKIQACFLVFQIYSGTEAAALTPIPGQMEVLRSSQMSGITATI